MRHSKAPYLVQKISLPTWVNKITTVFLIIFSFNKLNAEEWLHFIPDNHKEIGKRIVFVTGDDEYKSETSMPMMAHILANHHGFECYVLFAINRKTGVIDTNQRDNIPGLHFLAEADLMVIYTRFRSLVDDQMQMIENYLSTGKPIIGIRTATHAFDFSKVPDHRFAKYGYSNKSKDYYGGFGRQVLGETWVRHWGHHGKQSTRGRIAKGQEAHPILKGINDGEIWGPTDVYETALPQPEGCQAILLGEVCETMSSNSGPVAGKKNNPMMPIAWTWNRDVGAKGRVFTSTIGGAMAGKDDWANEGMRRMFVNACYWAVELEHKIPAKADVSPILQPNPFRRGVKPTEALEQALRLEEKKRTILFYGNSMVERLLEHGELEARLQIAIPNQKLKIRSLAWTGDEVGNRLRLERYAIHMNNLLKKWRANTIVLGYGMNEAFAGGGGLDEFCEHYDIHIRQIKNLHPDAKIVLLSPVATKRADTGLYARAISELAIKHGATFVDIHSITGEEDLINGDIHLNPKGNNLVARKVARDLLKIRGIQAPEPDPNHLIEVAKATSAKHFRVAEVVRPKNAAVYFGVRGRPYEYNAEMPRYHEMIRLTEEVIYEICSDPEIKFSEIPKPSLPPMGPGKGNDDGNRTGIIKPVAESEAEFKIADGYQVNLFASEEQFPELRNPVQITFDAKGRLWVVTMPSFPHTPPGLSPPDKIIILEDTDRDGKADKLTTFAEGFDALDGVAFHHDGVIVSEQPRLWLMRDTNGDDIADTKHELLRGIDVTDTHHGGMITTDPFGDIMFSDGVFHRSQLETPFGVVRGIDATTYRLNPITGRINTEWQHTTPNPWGITFDKWGNTFQVYGDGQVYDGSSLIWTPLGIYHPFRYALVCGYGKGSAVASVSSPNFPDRFKQAVASASLLGRYAVNLTAISYKDGMVKEVDHEAILSSPNPAFRPADVEFGMDGALYVSDFCSPIIGHAQHPMRDPHWDHDYGRIWRIVHTGKPIAKNWPKIKGASAEELCELLLHEQNIVRHHARIELRKIINSETDLLDEWLKSISVSPKYLQGVLEVVFIREGINKASPGLIQKLLKADNPFLRGSGVQALRQQADRINDIGKILSPLVNDPHPRVQIEVIDAVAHLRQTHPNLDSILASIQPVNKHVSDSLAYLDYGTKPAKGRSVPVLGVSPQSQLKSWQYLGENGDNKPVAMQLGQTKLPGTGLFRTFVYSKKPQSAIIAINHKNLKIWVNDVLKFSQNSLWSGDQQVNVELINGLNVIEVQLNKGRRAGGIMPPVYLYDPAGQVLSNTSYPDNLEIFQESVAEYEQMIAERGNLLFVQAAAGLQFSPTKMQVTAGSKIRLVFDNPDIMMHNWVLLKPGSLKEVGSLADKLAAQPDGMEKEYLPDSDKIIVASKLLGPKAKQEIVFTAPSEPGEYPYTCTFPGHWRMMQGVLTVAKPGPAKKVTVASHNTKPFDPAVQIDIANPAPRVSSSVPFNLPDLNGQYVRIELPGENRTLSLAEVQVFDQGRNLALDSPAIQSTIAFNGDPKLAVDGILDGHYSSGSVTHTKTQADPWWEVDFGKSINIEEIVIYNRTDSHAQRLDGFTLKVLSPERKVVFEKKGHPQSDLVSFLKAGVKSSKIAVKSSGLKDSLKKSAQDAGAHLFILAGQSNMVGLDPSISFIPAVNKAFGKEKVIIVKDAHNGQAICRWVKGWKSVQGKPVKNSGDLYDRMLEKVNQATVDRALKTVTLIWMQGEADAAGNQVGVYRSSLDRLLKQLKKDLAHKEIRFVLGRLSDYSLDTNKHPEWQDMRDLQVAYADATPLGAWVDTDDLNNKKRQGKPFNDVHYTKDGYRIFGDRLAQAAIEMLDPQSEVTFPGEKRNFRGYVRYSGIKTKHGNFSVVCPKKAAPGRPWLWRSLFWEAIQPLSNADLKLVDEGYHVVLAHGDVAGHPKGNHNIDAAYKMVTGEYGFSKKCSMASISRGTLSLFRWASSNPEKVESIYVDNGVCNVLSWPAGKLVPGNKSIASGAPASWEDFKKKFGYTSDAEALKTKENPIDLLEPLAKAGVPIITVCGNKDRAVPYEENDAILEQRYKALGGKIRVIVENKGHSHGMKDPTPVLEFIRNHTRETLAQRDTK